MDLDEFKNTWQEEDKNLDNKINLNENLLLKMNMENITGEFNKIYNVSVLGRNMALVYGIVSIVFAILMIEELVYSLPAIVGGFAMLGSFISHLGIEKPNYTVSLVQLQKTICQFRIHTANNAKYDMGIVALWLLTLAPVYLKYILNLSVYNDPKAFSVFALIAVVVITLMVALSRKMYKENDQKLRNSEAYLAQLIQFEKN